MSIDTRIRRDMIPRNETKVIAAIETLNKMEVEYRSEYGRYARSLTELGSPWVERCPERLGGRSNR